METSTYEVKSTKPLLKHVGGSLYVEERISISRADLLEQMGGSLYIKDLEGYTCKLCGIKFRLPQKRKRSMHLNMHRGASKKPFQCNECDCSFKTQDRLDSHIKDHERSKQLRQGTLDPKLDRQCPYCNKFFGTSTMYKEHVRTHPEANKFQCYECKEKFMYQYEFEQHLETSKHDKGPVILSAYWGATKPAKVKATKPAKVTFADKAPSLHPVCVLTTLVKHKIVFTTNKTENDNNTVCFTITANINGKQFTGKDTTIKKAKFNLAKDAIYALFGVDSKYPLP